MVSNRDDRSNHGYTAAVGRLGYPCWSRLTGRSGVTVHRLDPTSVRIGHVPVRVAETLADNGLVQSWPEITRLSSESGKPKIDQGGLFGETEE